MIKFLYDVRESLGAIASTAKDWDDRHTLREIQPRWTRDDEAAYAEEILIWKRKSTTNLRIIEQMGKRIETRIEHIKQLRAWLLNDLNLKEARLSNRSADVSNSDTISPQPYTDMCSDKVVGCTHFHIRDRDILAPQLCLQYFQHGWVSLALYRCVFCDCRHCRTRCNHCICSQRWYSNASHRQLPKQIV
jgi:uncharacterized protein YukE